LAQLFSFLEINDENNNGMTIQKQVKVNYTPFHQTEIDIKIHIKSPRISQASSTYQIEHSD
jgi:hypothetical protein